MTDKTDRIKEVAELRGRMKVCGVTITEMCSDLGMSRTTWSRWANGGDRLKSNWDAVEKYVSGCEDLKLLNELF